MQNEETIHKEHIQFHFYEISGISMFIGTESRLVGAYGWRGWLEMGSDC